MYPSLSQRFDRSGRIVSTMGELPGGRDGVIRTLAELRESANEARLDPLIRELALSIVGGLAGRDYRGEARAVQVWVQEHIRYVRDPSGAELLQSPRVTLSKKQGDCDDQTSLTCALLGSIGHKLRMVAIGFRPNSWAHVYSEVLIDGKWLALETIKPWDMGQLPPGIVSRIVAPMNMDERIAGFGSKLKKAFSAPVQAVKVAVSNPKEAVKQAPLIIANPVAAPVSVMKPALITKPLAKVEAAVKDPKASIKSESEKVAKVLGPTVNKVAEKVVDKTQPKWAEKIFGRQFGYHLARSTATGPAGAYALGWRSAKDKGLSNSEAKQQTFANLGQSAAILATVFSAGTTAGATAGANAAGLVGAGAAAAQAASAPKPVLEPDYTGEYIKELQGQLARKNETVPNGDAPAFAGNPIAAMWNRATPVEKTGITLGGVGLLITLLK